MLSKRREIESRLVFFVITTGALFVCCLLGEFQNELGEKAFTDNEQLGRKRKSLQQQGVQLVHGDVWYGLVLYHTIATAVGYE